MLHGRFFVQGNDNVFNTGNPFTAQLPSYYSYPVQRHPQRRASSKWASFFLSVEDRETTQTDNVVSRFWAVRSTTPRTNTWSISPGSDRRQPVQPRQPSQCLAAHRPATGAEEHADPALPVLPQQRERQFGRLDLAAHPGDPRHTSTEHVHSVGRYADHQRPAGERDALSSTGGTNTSSSPASTRAQLQCAGLFLWRRQRQPVLQLAHGSLRVAELHHLDQGHAGHQVRRLAARRPRGHHNRQQLQRQLHLSLRHGLRRHMERRRHTAIRLHADRARLAHPTASRWMRAHQAHLHHRATKRFRATCLTPRSLSRTIGR